MRPHAARSFAARAGLFGAILLAGCGRVYSYPDSESEQTAALCSDGRDNDYDGTADCGDPDCNGFCREETPAECSDGRDNDGDGVTDAADARCWLSRPPRAERCAAASGVEVFENFDGGFLAFGQKEASWRYWGTTTNVTAETSIVLHGLRGEAGRRGDWYAAFVGNATGSSELDTNLGALVREKPFSGSLRGLELSFEVSALPGSALRVAVVPIELAPTTDRPWPGAETNFLSVALDATSSPPNLSLVVEGREAAVAAPPSSALCGATLCSDYFGKLTLTVDDEGAVLARLTYPHGDSAEVRGSAPTTKSVPTARLVLWGGSTAADRIAGIDDLRMKVPPEWPCGFEAPQIPRSRCDAPHGAGAHGQSVSVAGGQREYCALVTRASRDESSSAPVLPLADSVAAFVSPDGESWTEASSDLPGLSSPATIVGAGIAADREGWHAAVVQRSGTTVQLGFSDASSCSDWAPVVSERTLFPDAESPSYVIRQGRHEIFFTRPPSEGETRRSLWRVWRDDPEGEPEQVAMLPPGVRPPVNIALAGTRDLVLAYTGAESPGVHLLVETASGWTALEPSPTLPPGSHLDTYEGTGQVSFDDRGLLSAALVWRVDGGFLLYAGASTQGDSQASRVRKVLSVGTALLFPEGVPLEERRVVPPPACGNGSCDAAETCTSCEADCPCGGIELEAALTSHELPWRVESLDPLPAGRAYLGLDPDVLNFAGGEPTWSSLSLERSIVGDFELAFDVLFRSVIAHAGEGEWCSVYVGLGTGSPLAEPSISPAGLFAELSVDERCGRPERYSADPIVVSGEGSRNYWQECLDDHAVSTDVWRHLSLRREGNRLTLVTPNSDGCGVTESTVTYAGALPPLSTLLVGHGGDPFAGCSYGGFYGTVANVELRLPADPDDCPKGERRCGEEAEQPTCVDTAASVEHCGGCDRACAAHEVCADGACRCAAEPEIERCDGVCVDTQSSSEHCGGCGQPCARLAGRSGQCVRGTCGHPIEECPSSGELTLGGSPYELTFAPGVAVGPICGMAFEPMYFTWTPGTDEVALEIAPTNVIVEARGLDHDVDTLLGVGAEYEATCGIWLSCNDNAVESAPGSRVRVEAIPDQTYRIAVGLAQAATRSERVELTLRVEP